MGNKKARSMLILSAIDFMSRPAVANERESEIGGMSGKLRRMQTEMT